MIYAINETILSDRYIPDLAVSNEANSLVIVTGEYQRNQFIYDTATYYASREIPVIFLGDPVQVAAAFSTFPENDILENYHITYFNDDIENLFPLIIRANMSFRLKPVIITLEPLPENKTEQARKLFEFCDKAGMYQAQSYMFADKKYDYLKDITVAGLDYFLNPDEQKFLMKIQFSK